MHFVERHLDVVIKLQLLKEITLFSSHSAVHITRALNRFETNHSSLHLIFVGCLYFLYFQACVYLFSGLSVHLWHPTYKNMDCIKSWLLKSDLSSPEHQLARYIISNLNWGHVGEVKKTIKDSGFQLIVGSNRVCFGLALLRAVIG